MTTILLATKNQDKIKLLSKLISDIYTAKNFSFKTLEDFNIVQDVEESGDIADRAKQKAAFYFDLLREKVKYSKVNYVLGVDDGIEIKKLGNKTPETKKMVDLIINDNLLKVGDVVSIIRAYCFIKIKTGEEKSIITEIPFKFIGNEKQIKRIEGKYPLSYLLSHLDKDIAIVDTSEQEVKEYDIRYSSKLLDLKL